MANRILLTFCCILLLSILFQAPLLGALFLGFLLFAGYGLAQGHSVKSILTMAWQGVLNVKTIFLVFLLIGMLTGVWRSAGTIAYLVTLATRFIRPSLFLLLAFWMNCAISVLLGSSFGAAATMGIITMKIGLSLGVPALYTGGTILSGVYFGDRMSPVSTSALLISVLTETDLYENLRNMVRSGLVPFLLTSLVYLVLGFTLEPEGSTVPDTQALGSLYTFTPWLLLPAVSILLLSFCKLSVKQNMLVSILLAALLSVLIQKVTLPQLLAILFRGYISPDPALAPMVNGGGILSMLRVGAIVCLSSSYAGLFKGTGLLKGLQSQIQQLALRIGCQPALTLAGLFTSLIACNQAFAIILTHQLCAGFSWEKEDLALGLENTVVVLSPLVPWSIACAVVLDSTGSPRGSIFVACFLYLLPLWQLWKNRCRNKWT